MKFGIQTQGNTSQPSFAIVKAEFFLFVARTFENPIDIKDVLEKGVGIDIDAEPERVRSDVIVYARAAADLIEHVDAIRDCFLPKHNPLVS